MVVPELHCLRLWVLPPVPEQGNETEEDGEVTPLFSMFDFNVFSQPSPPPCRMCPSWGSTLSKVFLTMDTLRGVLE